ncbi:MAG TPA: hypothetical protein VF727_15485 [Allosphingosinicella sp.]|jgi:hypothetical protein
MTQLAVASFFLLSLLAALVALHMTVRLYWREIVLALRGELGIEVRAPAPPRASAATRRAAA